MSSLVGPPRYTLADWETWPGDWELWEGRPVALASPVIDHQRLLKRLLFLLDTEIERLGCSCEVILELDWRVDHHTVFRPDIAVACRQDLQDYLHVAPEIIIEVLSPSTRQNDLLAKRFHYQQHGVRNYLTADPADGSLQRQIGDESGDTDETLDLPLTDRCRVTLPRVVQF